MTGHSLRLTRCGVTDYMQRKCRAGGKVPVAMALLAPVTSSAPDTLSLAVVGTATGLTLTADTFEYVGDGGSGGAVPTVEAACAAVAKAEGVSAKDVLHKCRSFPFRHHGGPHMCVLEFDAMSYMLVTDDAKKVVRVYTQVHDRHFAGPLATDALTRWAVGATGKTRPFLARCTTMCGGRMQVRGAVTVKPMTPVVPQLHALPKTGKPVVFQMASASAPLSKRCVAVVRGGWMLAAVVSYAGAEKGGGCGNKINPGSLTAKMTGPNSLTVKEAGFGGVAHKFAGPRAKKLRTLGDLKAWMQANGADPALPIQTFGWKGHSLVVLQPPAFLGAGTYGCVFKPVLPCKRHSGPVDGRRDAVSKVVPKAEGDGEVEENKLVKEIDPDGRFHLRLLGKCDIPIKDVPDSECPHLRAGWGAHGDGSDSDSDDDDERNADGSKKLSNLIMEAGSASLKHALEYGKTITNPDVAVQWVATTLGRLRRLTEALVVFHAESFVHADIKPDNLVLANDVYKLIDFGMSFRADPSNVDHPVGASKFYYAWPAKDGSTHPYTVWPPEWTCQVPRRHTYSGTEIVASMEDIYGLSHVDAAGAAELAAGFNWMNSLRPSDRATKAKMLATFARNVDAWSFAQVVGNVLWPVRTVLASSPRGRSALHRLKTFIDSLTRPAPRARLVVTDIPAAFDTAIRHL